MNLTTKFDINQIVWKVFQRPKETFIPCESCGGTGIVTLRNGQRSCPDCYGRRGRNEYGVEQFEVANSTLTVGEVRAYARNFKKSGMFDNIGSYKKGSDSFKVEYMCYETGIGSGTLHYEESLFDSFEKAKLYCEKENSKEIK